MEEKFKLDLTTDEMNILMIVFIEHDQLNEDVIQHAKGTADQPLMGPPKTSKNTLSNSSVS